MLTLSSDPKLWRNADFAHLSVGRIVKGVRTDDAVMVGTMALRLRVCRSVSEGSVAPV